MRQPFDLITQEAVRSLLLQINGNPSASVLFHAELVRRGSAWPPEGRPVPSFRYADRVTRRSNPGRRPTSKDVAALAGVAQSTVSYVMSGKRAISDETRRKVEDAIAQLTYQPNAGARALRGSGTRVIALVVRLDEDADVHGTVPYIDAVIDEARRHDYDVVLLTEDEGPAGLVRLAARSICDAFILMDIEADDTRIGTAVEIGLPTVLIGTPSNRQGLPAVDSDSESAARALVAELAHSGHRHVVLIGDSPSVQADSFHFIQRFQQVCLEESKRLDLTFELVRRERDGWQGLEDAGNAIFRHRRDRLGVIARTPQIAQWVVQLARIRGLSLGEDVSLVAFCTDAFAMAQYPAVSNVSPQPREVAQSAVRTLVDLLDGGAPATGAALVIPSQLTRRASTAIWS